MPNITIRVSEELKEEMKKHASVKWSSAIRSIIERKLSDFDEADRIARKSRFSMKDWKLIEKKLSKKTAEHAKALLNESNG